MVRTPLRLAGFGITFCIFGLAPAGILPEAMQQAIILGLGGIIVTGTLDHLFWQYALQRRFHFSLRALLGALTAIAVLCSLWLASGITGDNVSTMVTVAEQGTELFSASNIRAAWQLNKNSLTWAHWQWFLHNGPSLAVGLMILLVLLWNLFSGLPQSSDRTPQSGPTRSMLWLRQLFSSLAVSSFGLGLAMLSIYLRDGHPSSSQE